MADLPLVIVPHPVGTISLEQLHSLAAATIDSITANLLRQSPSIPECGKHTGETITSLSSTFSVSIDPFILFGELVKRGWSDGLPVLPPTRAAVDEMVVASGMDKDFVLGVMPPLNGVATLEKIAANAVMAGCLPEYFPLVIAGLKGALEPGFNLDGVQTTTGNVAPVMIINGPCRKSLDINCGANALGQGWRANASIGRALRLAMTNIGGATPGMFDKSTVGQPAKYTFCFGENEEESPWEPLHVERRFGVATSVVNVTGCSGVYSAVDMASQTAQGLLKTFGLTMTGGLASGVTTTEVVFVVCPEHAAIFAAAGYSKAAIRQELFGIARVPYEKISDENLELLAKRRPMWFKNGAAPEVGAVDRPEDIWLVVAGGAGAKSAYLPGRTGTRMQTVEVGK